MDVLARGEAGEREIDRFIERQAQRTGSNEANATAALWAASERKHLEKRRREHRDLWVDFHLGQAERLRRTMTALVEKHEAAAAQILEGTRGEGTS